MTIEEIIEKALVRLEQTINSGDQMQTAFLASAFKKLAEARDLSVIADSLLKLNKLEERVDQLQTDLTTADPTITQVIGSSMPILVREFINEVNNNWRYVPIPFGSPTEVLGKLTSENLDELKQLVKQARMHLEFNVRNRVAYEKDRKTYDNGWNEHNAVMMLTFLKNQTDEPKTVRIKGNFSSSDWRVHNSAVAVNGVLKALWRGNGIYALDTTFEVPPQKTVSLFIYAGAYRWTCWYGCVYVIRADFELELPEGIVYDFEVFKKLMEV